MKFTGYVAWIFRCKHCKFGEKICYNSGDIKFFLWDCLLLALYMYMQLLHVYRSNRTAKS